MATYDEIVKSIQWLCSLYAQDMVLTRRFLNKLNPRQRFKKEIADRLAKAYFIEDIQSILNEQSQEPPLTNRELMQQNSSHWVRWIFRRVFLVVLFPISISLMMWWSWQARRTIDFRRPDGAILIEEIDALCEQARIEQDNIRKENERYQQLYQKTLAHQSTIKAPIKPVMEKPTMNDSYELIRRFAPPASISSPTNGEEQKEMPEANNGSGQIEDSFQEISEIFNPDFLDGFFDLIEQSRRKKMTGFPIITSFRINPSMPEDDTFTIDIKWRFHWTNHSSKRITLPFLKHFTLPVMHRPEPCTNDIVIAPDPQYCGKQTVDWLVGFFAETLNDTLERANNTEGIYDKEAIYKQAYNMATNDQQRVLVLEQLIDALNDYHRDIRLRHLRDENIERRDKIWNKNLDKIKRYLSLLPANYASHSPRAVVLYDKLNAIYQLVQNNELDEAWQLYEQMPEINYFTERAFPHLKVMQLYLFIIFIITRHQLYLSRDKQIGTGIPEIEILADIKYFLGKICNLVDKYEPTQLNFIQLQLIAPLDQLKHIGQQAARSMSPTESALIFQSETTRSMALFKQGFNTLYRKPGESMDDDDDRVIELT